ncbi:DEAD/DEAH box helicase [Dermatophilus congolensis]|uniref:DEAD/DEAH box helicase n=1 Tax=Dermatophilus congolensis TaxID=1863 RepID=UPI001AAEBEA8|nr:ATP-dependent DNA helicase RecQ [Dermatophilus congolensis]MBO3131919.1 ATP-dependent DNA helicase RecQ [Dermatophilus congolensis]MBO3133924.1 ATP-dependent DNA helicase RecQ [Dermatophilus congolensis]MBO3136155.1 ATP-dependent DNA helicase RecQ [Dermatophilus congolensis]MBO3138399.1 ATP-dependent DNA helicase RecQ [Dermatophilus congolensis]
MSGAARSIPWQGPASEVISRLAGPGARLRDDQAEAVAALSHDGARVLVVQATGWGKSAVYWCATAARRAAGGGATLVLSPLLALMRDQIEAARRAGLNAVTLNSSNVDEWSAVEGQLAAGEVDVLLISPERLAHPTFGRRVLSALMGNMGLLVIDEAHAVSDWGHDFRPDYRRIAQVMARLDAQVPVLATTATANARVTQDVAAQLGEATTVLRGPLGRDSLQLAVVPPMSALQRYAWVAQMLPVLPGSGIVYALTIADAQRATCAVQAVHGVDYPVAMYTGQLEAAERALLEDKLRRNEVKALIATSALGMGYDKPDLGFVVHMGAPPSPVSYYQQVGRAGRGIEHALVALLPSAADEPVWRHFATATLPDEGMARRVLDALDTAEPQSVPALEAVTGLRRSRVELLLKQLAVDHVTERTPQGWVATGVPWRYDADHYAAIVRMREREAAIMRDYVQGRSCLMELLRTSLDDPQGGPCGQCSVCLGGLPGPLVPAADPAVTAVVAEQLRSIDHQLPARKMWPGGQFGRRGRIPAGEMVLEGRVVIDMDAPQWCEVIEACLQAPGDAPRELCEAAVGVLRRWSASWPQRPSLICSLATLAHPQGPYPVAGQVAAYLGEVGRIEVGHWLVRPPVSEVGERPAGGAEAALWQEAIAAAPPPQLSGGGGVAGRDVLLVVDRSASGWPITLAGAGLRRWGAGSVHPLLLHRCP